MAKFNVKIKLDRNTEDGSLKRVTEQYLVDAMSCTEAEARLYEFLEKDGLIETKIPIISESNFSDIFPSDIGEIWYKAKVSFVSIDEQAGKEKKINQYMLIQAEDLEGAMKNLKEGLKGFTVPYEMHAITDTKIIDFIDY